MIAFKSQIMPRLTSKSGLPIVLCSLVPHGRYDVIQFPLLPLLCLLYLLKDTPFLHPWFCGLHSPIHSCFFPPQTSTSTLFPAFTATHELPGKGKPMLLSYMDALQWKLSPLALPLVLLSFSLAMPLFGHFAFINWAWLVSDQWSFSG